MNFNVFPGGFLYLIPVRAKLRYQLGCGNNSLSGIKRVLFRNSPLEFIGESGDEIESRSGDPGGVRPVTLIGNVFHNHTSTQGIGNLKLGPEI